MSNDDAAMKEYVDERFPAPADESMNCNIDHLLPHQSYARPDTTQAADFDDNVLPDDNVPPDDDTTIGDVADIVRDTVREELDRQRPRSPNDYPDEDDVEPRIAEAIANAERKLAEIARHDSEHIATLQAEDKHDPDAVDAAAAENVRRATLVAAVDRGDRDTAISLGTDMEIDEITATLADAAPPPHDLDKQIEKCEQQIEAAWEKGGDYDDSLSEQLAYLQRERAIDRARASEFYNPT